MEMSTEIALIACDYSVSVPSVEMEAAWQVFNSRTGG